MRFTERYDDIFATTKDGKETHEKGVRIKDKVGGFEKLANLEDIEKELGIDLIKVCSFAMNGGYYKGESPLAQPTDISPTSIVVNFLFKYFDCYDNCLALYFKDYGKTWALTKEELL